jgi:CobQ-like glutamine amidotransferase family enzyme
MKKNLVIKVLFTYKKYIQKNLKWCFSTYIHGSVIYNNANLEPIVVPKLLNKNYGMLFRM